jgi:GNAT superfamily N-acetyltransferase
MDTIQYQRVDAMIAESIRSQYGEMQASQLHLEEHSYSLAALDGETVVGFISICPKDLDEPLETYTDAFIDILEVHPQYRRRGIGSLLVRAGEEWAAEHGFTQIRAWSSTDKTEAIKMWHALEYGLCPALQPSSEDGRLVSGYHAVKCFRHLF